MFNVDTHVHSSPTSTCAQVKGRDLPLIFKNKWIDAFVLTNHYNHHHFKFLGSSESEQKMQYVSAFYDTFDAGKEVGVKVFFGSEVKVNDVRIVDEVETPFYPEFLLFGLTPELILKSPLLNLLSQKELFDFCSANDLLMYQTHPYRTAQGYYPANPTYMHGVEVFNGHPNFPPRCEDAMEFATQNTLKLSAGSDLHIESQAGAASMMLQEKVADSLELCAYLKEHNPIKTDAENFRIDF